MATRSVTCEETIDVLVDYLDGSMDATTLAAFEAHFADCPPCLDFLKTYKATIRVSQACMQEEAIPEPVSQRIREFLRLKCQGKKPGEQV
ncbi:MAG TPA: zf-HC2 domain-containing protein [bacterium]|nr:zf-HC2 domain-containing protein [bacterium]